MVDWGALAQATNQLIFGTADRILDSKRDKRNFQFQQEAFNYNKEWNQKTFDEDLRRYEETKEREDTIAQRTVADYRAAGLNPATIGGGAVSQASGSTPSQANMLEAPQEERSGTNMSEILNSAIASAAQVAQIRNIEADTKTKEEDAKRKTVENEILEDTKEWKKFAEEQNAKKAWNTNVGQELANRLASIMQNQEIEKAQIQNDILKIEKKLKENEQNISEKEKKQMEILGILPGDSDEIKSAKLRKIYKNLEEYDGDTQDFIKAYGQEYNDRNNKSLLNELANIMSGIPGTAIRQISSMIGKFTGNLGDYQW